MAEIEELLAGKNDPHHRCGRSGTTSDDLSKSFIFSAAIKSQASKLGETLGGETMSNSGEV
jgi:hypothetical protein